MRKTLKFLAYSLVIVSTLLLKLTVEHQNAYAYSTTPKIVAGYSYAFGLKSDGNVYGWGNNTATLSASPLGIGYSSSGGVSITNINISNIKDLVTADSTSFALLDNGTVLTWGTNGLCQMGLGGTSSNPTNKRGYNSPTLHPYLSDVKRIITNNKADHVFAITNAGSIYMWGYNGNGQLGNGTKTTVLSPTVASISDVKDIAVGNSHTLMLKNNGTVYATGWNASGQLGINSTTDKSSFTLISSLSGADRIFAGGSKSFVIKSDGSIYAWGRNTNGDLGVGTTGNKKVPTLVSGLTNPSQISAGDTHVAILMPDGTVKTAGDNSYGQLGYSGGDSYSFNTIPGITNAIQVEAGAGYTLVLLEDGTVKSFGKSTVNQLGLGYSDSSVHSTPTTIPSLLLIPDIIPPIITIDSYNTSPTKQDITVTASTNEGTLNATSHLFTENGSFEFVATDAAGNISRKVVTISNIDKTAPIITLGSYNTNPTNQDITITATANEGKLNTTSHVFAVNGSFDFIATDLAGNITIKTVTITNIDKIAPIITVNSYNTEQTNKDITVTVTTNKGTLNVSSHVFTENGSFDFIATDVAGNVTTKTVTINNIDKSAPIITIGGYSTNPTNQDITITATTDKGILNATSHTFTENGSFNFVATDNLGNSTTKTVSISNIDKNAPSSPVISVIDNKIVITSGTDTGSGVKEILYQVNGGNWKTFTDEIVLTDGTYVVSAKTVDYAGNESACDIYNVNVYKNALDEANKAMDKAESTHDQEDLDIALTLISTLPDGPEKTNLAVRADNLQKIIDANNHIKLITDTDEIARLQIVNFTINTTDLDDLYTMQFEIKYDPNMLELEQADMKNLAWDTASNSYAAVKIDSIHGIVDVIYSKKGIIEGESGDSDLIVIPFKAIQIGKTSISTGKIKLINSHGEKIQALTKTITKEINILPNPLNINLSGNKGQNDWYVSPVTVEIKDLDAKEIHYSLDGVKYDYTQPFAVDTIGKHNLIVTTDDGNGYIKEKAQVIKIDNVGTTITVNNQINDWQNEVKVVPSFDDQNGSGLSKAWYQWTDTENEQEQWEEYNQSDIIMTTEGNWYLHIKAIDIAGNVSKTVFGPYKIDSTLPTISVDIDKREAWASTGVNVTPSFTDEGGSLLKYVGYQWSKDKTASQDYDIYTSGALQQANDGAWYLHLIAKDYAGNIKTMVFGPYNIDNKVPDIVFSEVSEGKEYIDSVAPIIIISDSASGIKNKIIKLDGQDFVSGTTITERGPHIINATAEDNMGNTESKSISFTIFTSTTLALDIPQTEYSDTFTISATLTTGSQTVSGGAVSVSGGAISVPGGSTSVSGAAISIKLNGIDMGTYYTDSQGNIKLSGIASMKAGSYTVEAKYIPEASDYFVGSQSQSSLTILSEKVNIDYTEEYDVLYPGALAILASVDQEDDGSSGDLSLAKVGVKVTKHNTDGTTTAVDNFITNCDAEGKIEFVKNYNKGSYTVAMKLLDDGYYNPATANITVLVH